MFVFLLSKLNGILLYTRIFHVIQTHTHTHTQANIHIFKITFNTTVVDIYIKWEYTSKVTQQQHELGSIL